MAYYTLLSLAPLVLLLVAIYGLAFPRSAAEQQLLKQVHLVAGSAAVNAIQSLVNNVHQTKNGVIAAVFATLLLFFGASSVFTDLRGCLNTIWDAPVTKSCLKQVVWRRIVSFGLVLALGLLLLASLLLGAILDVLRSIVFQLLPAHAAMLAEIENVVLSFLAVGLLFALIFKVIPDVPIAWRDVTIGSVVTAFLFTLGRALLAIYFGETAVGSVYGAAGALVAFIIWVYYSAQIFFFGAIFTRVYALQCGSHSRRARNQQMETSA